MNSLQFLDKLLTHDNVYFLLIHEKHNSYWKMLSFLNYALYNVFPSSALPSPFAQLWLLETDGYR